MKKNLLTIFCFLFVHHLVGQGHGYYVAYPKPKDAIIRIDTTKINPYQVYNLNPGNYILRAWAQGYKLYIDTISIESSKYTHSKLKLARSDEYLRYRAAVKKQRKGFRISGYAAVGCTVIGVLMHIKATEFEDDASQSKNLYLEGVTPTEILNAKTDYQKSIDDYKTYKTYRNVSFAALAGVGIIGGYLSYKYYKNNKAEYKEDVPQLSSITPYYDPISNTSNLTAIFLIK